ncbi:hypothetical protein N0V85_005099 [Neurospora sp. IMI 360204]|nr:hypothetical protein N0V85_005099 [Neurospora sp. IMI 360204]
MNQQQDLVRIGKGHCGSVWTKRLSDDNVDVDDDDDIMPSRTIIKRGDGTKFRSVTNENDIHKQIARLAIATKASKSQSNLITGHQVNIPQPIDFITSDSSEWAKILPLLPQDYKACIALRNERIPPMQKPIRQLLTQTFVRAHNKLAAALLDAEKNEQNCLVRPFLGRRRYLPAPQSQQATSTGSERPKQDRFQLRNFPLHLDQIEELGLPVEEYAMAMADTMAFLHWEAEVDAGDVEFVLARPRHQPASSSPPPSIGSKPFTQEGVFGPHAMWLLDFDCCKKMTIPTEDDNEEAEVAYLEDVAKAFWRNDPWYPRPPDKNRAGSEHYVADGQLWEKFTRRYMETSEEIMEGKGKDEWVRELPGKAMDMIVKTRGRWKKSAV